MSIETLQRHFADCRLPVEFVKDIPQRQHGRYSPLRFNTAVPAPTADDFCFIDVAGRGRDEYFRLYLHSAAEMYLRDKRPQTRHLLLQLRCFPTSEHKAEVRNFLLGHDERQLFVVRPQAGETVQAALDSLKPRDVQIAEQQGLKVIRQGDWFFIPMPSNYAPPDNGLHFTGLTIGGVNARRLGITVGNPHIAEEQVIVDRQWRSPAGLLMRSVTITVRGKIRHDEHSTVELRAWHRAVQNTTVLTAAPPSIGYYD